MMIHGWAVAIAAACATVLCSVLFDVRTAAAQSIVHVDDSVKDGLAAHWKFDEPSASTAREIIGGADGTLVVGATLPFGPLPPVGFSDPAVLALDGAGGRVDVADNVTLNAATAVNFTVAMWVRRDAADIGTASTLYDSGTQTGHWYVGFLSNNKLTFTKNAVADLQSSHILTDTDWHHVAFVRESSGSVTVYLDGVAAAPLSAGAITAPSGPKVIGNKQTLNTPLDGFIDDLRIYNRALTVNQVQRLAQGKGCVTDGGTWETALRELQCGLAEAVSGAQIWIGEGVYKPGLYRFAPFVLENGVDLYGGFRGLSPGGNETALDQRPAFDPAAPLTTLSGDILGNDLPASFGNYDENHIVVLLASGGVTARVDGLRVQGGNADGPVGGLSNNGGGLRAAAGSAVTLRDVAFFANRSKLDGGAVYSQAPLQVTAAHFNGNTSTSGNGGALAITAALALTGSTFLSNNAANDGGALYVQPGSLTAANNVYTGNSAGQFGGAVFAAGELSAGDRYLNNQAGSEGGALLADASMTVTHAIFDGNRAGLSGAIVIDGPDDRSRVLHVQNSLFTRNQRTGGAGAADIRAFDMTARFVNNTFADPAPGSTPAIQVFRSTITVANNIFANYGASVTESSVGGASAVQVDRNLFFNAPLGASISPGAGNLSGDPRFVNATAGDYRVQAGSPAIDAGADSALAPSVAQDLAGKPRFVNIPGVVGAVIGGVSQSIDLGAYEFQNSGVFLPLITR